MATNLSSDRNLATRDIQQLSNADAIAAFFASLGYGTDARLAQTPAAMGITAESLQRKIRRIERLADQEDGLLQIYLVELDYGDYYDEDHVALFTPLDGTHTGRPVGESHLETMGTGHGW